MIKKILKKAKIDSSNTYFAKGFLLVSSILVIFSIISVVFIFQMYAEPEFLIMIANQVWGCF